MNTKGETLEKINEEKESENDTQSEINNNTFIVKNNYPTDNPEEFNKKILNINQRMLAFKTKVYDKLDLKRIVQYWFDSRAFISTKLNDRKSSSYNKIDNIKKTKEKDDKKTEKYETNVKYDYKKPDNDLLKIIPFCNNIFSIQKSDN